MQHVQKNIWFTPMTLAGSESGGPLDERDDHTQHDLDAKSNPGAALCLRATKNQAQNESDTAEKEPSRQTENQITLPVISHDNTPLP